MEKVPQINEEEQTPQIEEEEKAPEVKNVIKRTPPTEEETKK